jgi:3-phenylpropionate/trans-cinnamate dioxygenase ferredoxin reductase subunit
VSPTTERKVEALTIRIDRNACAGFKDCIKVAPEAFDLGDDGVVVFKDPEVVEVSRLIEACGVCPAKALTVLDENGKQLVP